MSSKGSKRQTARKAAGSSLGKLKKENEQLRAALGEARMSVLNMRQMYRQAEQELAHVQQALQAKETLVAAVLFAMDTVKVTVSPQDMEDLNEAYSSLEINPDGEGNTVVTLVPFEEEDEDVSEVSAE